MNLVRIPKMYHNVVVFFRYHLAMLAASAVFHCSNPYCNVVRAQVNFTLDGDWKCNGNVICGGNTTSTTDGELFLTPPSGLNASLYNNTAGVAYYIGSVRMLDASGQAMSFSSSFSFAIFRSPYGSGDGMTFSFVSDPAWVGTPGSNFGIYSDPRKQPKILAVEYDTVQNPELNDIDDNHIGIDINSPLSMVSKSAEKLNIKLYGGVLLYTWIDYDVTSQSLEVRLNNAPNRPDELFLSYNIDLKNIVDENMWVGFSAANGNCLDLCHNTYNISNWSFKTTGAFAGSNGKKTTNKSLILGLAISIPLSILLVVMGLLLMYVVKRTHAYERGHDAVTVEMDKSARLGGVSMSHRTFSYDQLSMATGGFSTENKLGQGGSGSVYRGVLRGVGGGLLVAVKRIDNESKEGEREFMAEVSTISQLRHRNIVRLLGWCKDNGKFLLAYEFMRNGSLNKALYGHQNSLHNNDDILAKKSDIDVLSWPQRLNIAIGIAAALQYLHEGWRQQVIHRDIKSGNIMLDDNFNAMLGDFGLARLVDHQKNADTTRVAGTFGYIAPEVPVTGKYTNKSDTFAFGAVALEIACGRKAYDPTLPADKVILLNWVWGKLSKGDLMSVVDPKLDGNFHPEQMRTLLLMGLLCSHPDPEARPPMHQVVQVLAGRVSVPDVPPFKPVPVYLSDFPGLVLDTALYPKDSETKTLSN